MRTLVVTLTALLLAAAPAEAKQIEKVVVCGDGHQCTTLENGRDGDLMVFANGGPPVDGPTAPGAFYRVRMTMLKPDTSARHRWTNIWVPGLERVANTDGSWQWTATAPAQATA